MPKGVLKEKDIQKSIMEWLKLNGFRVERMNSGGMSGEYESRKTGKKTRRFLNFGFPGMPDLMVFLKDGSGRTLFIEVKTQKGKLNPNQIIFRDFCHEMKIPHIVARSICDVSSYFSLSGG